MDESPSFFSPSCLWGGAFGTRQEIIGEIDFLSSSSSSSSSASQFSSPAKLGIKEQIKNISTRILHRMLGQTSAWTGSGLLLWEELSIKLGDTFWNTHWVAFTTSIYCYAVGIIFFERKSPCLLMVVLLETSFEFFFLSHVARFNRHCEWDLRKAKLRREWLLCKEKITKEGWGGEKASIEVLLSSSSTFWLYPFQVSLQLSISCWDGGEKQQRERKINRLNSLFFLICGWSWEWGRGRICLGWD